jgi:transcriptional regulator with XRE-family HTH domain
MTIASSLVHQARVGAGLTQGQLGAFAHVRQPAVARAERGTTGLTVDVLDRLVRAAGWRLAVLPGRSGTAADAAESIAALLATGSGDGPYRVVIQLADDLAAEHGAERVALAVAPPPPTGDIRFDALLAGVVEVRLNEERLPHPRWLATAAHLDSLWYVDEHSQGDAHTVTATPAELLARGVILDAAELVSA